MPRPRFVAVPAELVRHLMPARCSICGTASVRGARVRFRSHIRQYRCRLHWQPAAACGGAGAPIRRHRLGIIGAWLIRVLGGLTPVEYTRGVLLRTS